MMNLEQGKTYLYQGEEVKLITLPIPNKPKRFEPHAIILRHTGGALSVPVSELSEIPDPDRIPSGGTYD